MSDLCPECGKPLYGDAYTDGLCWHCTSFRNCHLCGLEFPKDDGVHECTFSCVCGVPLKSARPDPTNIVNMAKRFARCSGPQSTVNNHCRAHDKTSPLRSDHTHRPKRFDWLRIAAPVDMEELLRMPMWKAWMLSASAKACGEITRSIPDRWGPIEPPTDEWVVDQRRLGRTLEDIGLELGVTRERVRQREIRGLETLRLRGSLTANP